TVRLTRIVDAIHARLRFMRHQVDTRLRHPARLVETDGHELPAKNVRRPPHAPSESLAQVIPRSAAKKVNALPLRMACRTVRCGRSLRPQTIPRVSPDSASRFRDDTCGPMRSLLEKDAMKRLAFALAVLAAACSGTPQTATPADPTIAR